MTHRLFRYSFCFVTVISPQKINLLFYISHMQGVIFVYIVTENSAGTKSYSGTYSQMHILFTPEYVMMACLLC
jgi:hypothetical protein